MPVRIAGGLSIVISLLPEDTENLTLIIGLYIVVCLNSGKQKCLK